MQAWYTSMECRCVQLRTVVSYWHLTNPSVICRVTWFLTPVSEDDFRSSDSQNDFSQVTLTITSAQMSLTTTSAQRIQLHLTTTWLWRWLLLRLLKRQSQTTALPRTPITQMIFFNQSYSVLLSRSCHGHFEKALLEVKRNFTELGHKQELHLFLVILRALE